MLTYFCLYLITLILGDVVFGYVKICKPELKIKDYEIYKGVYCSLCKEMGRSFGVVSRLALSYDFAFLALMKMSLDDKCPKVKKGHCSFNPFHKCNCFEKDNKWIRFSAYIAMIMMYYKIKDDIEDNGFFKKIASLLMLPIAKVFHKKAKKKYVELDCVVEELMKQQKELENKKCENIDVAANPTATALGEIFAYSETDEQQKRIIQHLGYCVGRYVYIIDAIDDLDEDLKTGEYNTFAISHSLLKGDDTKSVKLEAGEIIDRTISEIINTYELLTVNRFDNIFDNIFYEGLYKEKERVVNKGAI